MEKGTAGYIKAYKKKYGFMALGFGLAIVAMVVGIYLILGSVKHVAVVAPILLTLPFSKIFILWVIVAKYKSISKDDVIRIEEALSERRNIRFLYDMALSAYESVSYASCVVIDQGNVYLLWGGATQKEFTEKDQNSYVQNLIDKAGYDYQVITVYSVDELIEAVSSEDELDEDVSNQCNHIRQRLLDVAV